VTDSCVGEKSAPGPLVFNLHGFNIEVPPEELQGWVQKLCDAHGELTDRWAAVQQLTRAHLQHTGYRRRPGLLASGGPDFTGNVVHRNATGVPELVIHYPTGLGAGVVRHLAEVVNRKPAQVCPACGCRAANFVDERVKAVLLACCECGHRYEAVA
jgi:hypothetical protein